MQSNLCMVQEEQHRSDSIRVRTCALVRFCLGLSALMFTFLSSTFFTPLLLLFLNLHFPHVPPSSILFPSAMYPVWDTGHLNGIPFPCNPYSIVTYNLRRIGLKMAASVAIDRLIGSFSVIIIIEMLIRHTIEYQDERKNQIWLTHFLYLLLDQK